jgi:amino acid transporter
VATREVNSESTSGAARAGPARAQASAPSGGPVRAERQREEFGGLNWGAACFGWLVAVGIAAILTAFVSAAGAAIGLTDISSSEAKKNAATIGIGGAIALLIVLLLAYYAGGYVAGRMSRFDGGRQGFGAWLIGVIITVLFAAAGAIFGSKYNVLSALKLPRIPVQEGTLATGAAITLAVIVLGTLIAAVLGGRVGRRYHRKVDRAALT